MRIRCLTGAWKRKEQPNMRRAWLESSSVKPNAATPGEASWLWSYIKELEQLFQFPGGSTTNRGGEGVEYCRVRWRESWELESPDRLPTGDLSTYQMPGMGGKRWHCLLLTRLQVQCHFLVIFSSTPILWASRSFPIHTIALGMWVINVLQSLSVSATL